ncbi:hypothetical protein AHF37_03367, partial [Paragonimus kellicotti]
ILRLFLCFLFIAVENRSPEDVAPPYNTQTSKPLPDIFADKPIGAAAKWDQVDWDTVDEFEDPSKTGTRTGDKLSRKSTGAKPVPTTKKKEAVSGGSRVDVQPDKPEDTSIKEAVADAGVSDTSKSRTKAHPVGGKSGTKSDTSTPNNDPGEKNGEPKNSTELQSPSPLSPGKYNINWDEIDESFNPFGSKAGPLKTKPPSVKPTPNVAAVSQSSRDAVAKTEEKTITKEPTAASEQKKPKLSVESASPQDEPPPLNTQKSNPLLKSGEQSKTREEPINATVTETDSPTSPGKYNINWDEIDESFNPFGPKAGPLKTKPPLAKPHPKAAAASKVDKTKTIRSSKDPMKLPTSPQDAPMDHQPLTSQGAYDVNWDELSPSSNPFGKSGSKLPPKSPMQGFL